MAEPERRPVKRSRALRTTGTSCTAGLYYRPVHDYKAFMAHPSGLTPEQLEEYLHRSYTRVDGLWFVLLEERYGFEEALALDQAVWKILPKIQARLLRDQLRLPPDVAGLARALQAKLSLDRFEFHLAPTSGLELEIARCPWHELMLRSGRAHLAERVGRSICGIEMPVFAREFNCSCLPPDNGCLCGSGARCRFRFEPLPG